MRVRFDTCEGQHVLSIITKQFESLQIQTYLGNPVATGFLQGPRTQTELVSEHLHRHAGELD